MRDRHTKLLVAIGGSLLLAVGAIVVIFAVGVRHVPDYPTIAEQPDPPVEGRLAYSTWDVPADVAPYSGGPCLFVQDIGGSLHTISCGEQSLVEGSPGLTAFEQFPQWFGWDDDGHLLVAEYISGPSTRVELVTIDVDTGEELSRDEIDPSTQPPDRSQREDGARVGTTWGDDGWAEVWMREPGLPQRQVLRDRGPDGYAFFNAQWSPRGDFVLVQDNERRTIVIAAEGDPVPRVLLSDAESVAWYQPT